MHSAIHLSLAAVEACWVGSSKGGLQQQAKTRAAALNDMYHTNKSSDLAPCPSWHDWGWAQLYWMIITPWVLGLVVSHL